MPLSLLYAPNEHALMAAGVQHTRATSSAPNLHMSGVVVGGNASVWSYGPTSPHRNLTYLAALSVRVAGEIIQLFSRCSGREHGLVA